MAKREVYHVVRRGLQCGESGFLRSPLNVIPSPLLWTGTLNTRQILSSFFGLVGMIIVYDIKFRLNPSHISLYHMPFYLINSNSHLITNSIKLPTCPSIAEYPCRPLGKRCPQVWCWWWPGLAAHAMGLPMGLAVH